MIQNSHRTFHEKSILAFLFIIFSIFGFAQSNKVMHLFPEGTLLHGNIPYLNDTEL